MFLQEIEKRYPPGTWVRFLRQGTFTIGKVENYRVESARTKLYTDVDMVDSEDVLEARKPE